MKKIYIQPDIIITSFSSQEMIANNIFSGVIYNSEDLVDDDAE